MNKKYSLKKLLTPVIYTGIFLLAGILQMSAQTNKDSGVKVAVVYTVTTPELKADLMREIRNQLGMVEVMIYEIPSVFEEIKSTGYVTAAPAAKLIGVFMKAVEEGADAILSVCSTVGDIAYSMQDVAKYTGVPVVMINEEMCREAVRKGTRIAVMATFPTAIRPTVNTLHRISREMGKHVEVTEVLVEGGFGLDQEEFKALMSEKSKEVAGKVDVIMFAQGSMAYCEDYIKKLTGKEVFSNPYFGAKALKDALIAKGCIVTDY